MTQTLEHLSLVALRLCKNRDLLRLALRTADREHLPDKHHRAIKRAFRAHINMIADLDPIIDTLSGAPSPDPL